MCVGCHHLYPQRSKWRIMFPEWTDESLDQAAVMLDRAWTTLTGGTDG